MVMANQQTSELAEPCIGSFNDPATFVPSTREQLIQVRLLGRRKFHRQDPK